MLAACTAHAVVPPQAQALKRQQAEAAAMAACTFRPDTAPAASAGSKYGAARPHISTQASPLPALAVLPQSTTGVAGVLIGHYHASAGHMLHCTCQMHARCSSSAAAAPLLQRLDEYMREVEAARQAREAASAAAAKEREVRGHGSWLARPSRRAAPCGLLPIRFSSCVIAHC